MWAKHNGAVDVSLSETWCREYQACVRALSRGMCVTCPGARLAHAPCHDDVCGQRISAVVCHVSCDHIAVTNMRSGIKVDRGVAVVAEPAAAEAGEARRAHVADDAIDDDGQVKRAREAQAGDGGPEETQGE